MLLIAAFMAAALAPAVPAGADAGMADVAYTELAAGDAEAAVRKLEERAGSRTDPALLINLGAAYARQGATDKALSSFRAAIASQDRYDLELSNGRWMDSRVIARQALANLQSRMAQAAR